MTRLALSRTSKIEPDPWRVDHGKGIVLGYTCHMAAMHWAQMVLESDQPEANRIVSAFTRANCPGCTGNGQHGSIRNDAYASHFCARTKQILSRDALFDMVEVGDVLITGRPSTPVHTMILRQKRGPGHVTVRGFNNFMTLGTGARDAYDPVSHNITKDKYWRDPAKGGFGHFGTTALFVIAHDDFMSASRMLRQKFPK